MKSCQAMGEFHGQVLLYDLTRTYFESSPNFPPAQYLVGTSRGRLAQYEQALLAKTWQQARLGVEV